MILRGQDHGGILEQQIDNQYFTIFYGTRRSLPPAFGPRKSLMHLCCIA
jgi:hypothetical protein